ncbi:MAG: type IV secretory system conjugative DNA transfer family protein [Lachnospiraceae bacterium]|nr:type IV secretory system conjugative DNA transfer family protein [Lachnospiraceae bacterium]
MPRLSAYIEKLENRLHKKFGRWYERNRGKLPLYVPLALTAWYFYGMFVNSLRLGKESVFNTSGEVIESIWVLNPIKNLFAPFTPFGLGATAVIALLICLITKKGYTKLSGYKFTRDKRGFDILPDGTHGTGGFMSKKEMEQIVETGSLEKLDGTILGKLKDAPEDDDKFSEYVTLKKDSGLTEHTMIYGATGSGKSRGFVKPFILQCVRRKESLIIVDPKGEFYETMSGFLRDEGCEVKLFDLLDMEYSDAWNCLAEAGSDPNLVQSIAEVIINNTSNSEDRQDFWSKAELNLLVALIHYVIRLTGPDGRLLPIEQRSLGTVYRLLSGESFQSLEQIMNGLPKEHPAKAPYGIFKLANRQIWGNIAIGLGNRLAVFQNPLVDKITSYNEIDLTLPGQKPCVYFCAISDQDSSLEFLSSLFFSQLFSRLMSYARRNGINGRLPVTVNVCLEEFCNIGKLVDFKKVLSVCRSRGINCQIIVQSVSQLSDRYQRREWEELIGNCDVQICLGCNDQMTAEYISDKCGSVTIRVNNNQFPLMPLFSPVYGTTRPYSQTRSNTQRALMQPDEVLRLDNRRCLVLLRGQRPLLLYKIIPDEFPAFKRLRPTPVSGHIPEWRKARETRERTAPPSEKPMPRQETENKPKYVRELTPDNSTLGMVEVTAEDILGKRGDCE